jgi:glutathione S-transferase
MRLIGMLDSPYVRRVAISLQLLGLDFEHRPVSVFRAFDEFHAINPVVKAPSLVCDDGTVLMDSSLMLEYAESLAQAQGRRSLMPANLASRQADLRIIGLALAACEKSVQIIYERGLRPPEKQHEPWVERVTGQLLAAFAGLEAEVARRPLAATTAHLSQAGVTTAVTWHFTQALLPQVVPAARFATLAAFSATAETLAPFIAAAHGDGTCVPVFP